jgi:hypothetical protein
MSRYGLIGAIEDNLNQMSGIVSLMKQYHTLKMSLEVQTITELLEEARQADLPEGIDMLLSEALDHLDNLL